MNKTTPAPISSFARSRPSRAKQLGKKLNWTTNISLGASIESESWLHRLQLLKEIDANIRFISLEPLLRSLTSMLLNLGFQR